MKDSLRSEAGTYIVILKIVTPQRMEIGKLGNFYFEKGYYLYIGSAHGPGGIKSRIKRHLKKDKAEHWHIDYLRKASSVAAIFFNYSKKKKECVWASKLSSSSHLSTPIIGFGSSDCLCPSHLFFGKQPFNIGLLKDIIVEPAELIRFLPHL